MSETVEQIFSRTFWDLYKALKEEADHWWKELQSHYQDDFLRRAAVRATFACVEGVIFGLKQLALALPTKNTYTLTAAEEALLREKTYKIDKKGMAGEDKAKIGLSSNLLFTFYIVAKIMGESSPIDVSKNEWKIFKDAIEIRDRLMHPKSVAALEVSDEEIQKVNQAYCWFHNNLNSLFRDHS